MTLAQPDLFEIKTAGAGAVHEPNYDRDEGSDETTCDNLCAAEVRVRSTRLKQNSVKQVKIHDFA